LYKIEVSRDSVCAADDANQAFSVGFMFDGTTNIEVMIEDIINTDGFREIAAKKNDVEIWELVVNETSVAKITTVNGLTHIDSFFKSLLKFNDVHSKISFRFVRKINEMKLVRSKLEVDKQKARIERAIKKHNSKHT
jgi:hypothetical protein